MSVTNLRWRGADGVVTPFTDSTGFRVLRGVIGLDAPTPRNTVDEYNAFDGGVLTNLRRGVRPVVIPLFVTHPTRVQTRINQLAALLQDQGRLEYHDGTNTRYLRDVIYEAGLEGDKANEPRPTMRKVAVSLIALDPWWYGEDVVELLAIDDPALFDDPDVDFDDDVAFDGGTTTVLDVAGDDDAFPVFTVYGPASTLRVIGDDLSWEAAAPLGSSDILVVDTRPGSRGPRINARALDWSLLTEESRLWTLPPGEQPVSVIVTGDSPGSTAIEVEYAPRWLTP